MKNMKVWAVGLAFLAAQGLWAADAKMSDLDQRLKNLEEKEKVETAQFESQIKAVNAKYDPQIQVLEKQLTEIRQSMRSEVDPLLSRIKAIHDKYVAEKRPIQNAALIKQQLKEMDDRERLEKMALEEKKNADIKSKAAPEKTLSMKFKEDLKALTEKFKSERQKLEASLKEAMADLTKKK